MTHKFFVLVLTVLSCPLLAEPPLPVDRQVSLTFDDLPAASRSFPGSEACNFSEFRARTEDFLRVVHANRLPVAAFVNSGRACASWTQEQLADLLQLWLDAEATLGNHTFSHVDSNGVALEEYKRDIIRGEEPLRTLLQAQGQELRYFRHPYLHSGKDPTDRDRLQEFLAERSYVAAPVTIDNQDWVFAPIYAAALERNDLPAARRVSKAYIDYIDELFRSNEELSLEIHGYEVRQVLLMHASALNFDNLSQILRVVEDRGYRFVSLDRALEDAAYETATPTNGSLLRAWAYASGIDPAPPNPHDFLGTSSWRRAEQAPAINASNPGPTEQGAAALPLDGQGDLAGQGVIGQLGTALIGFAFGVLAVSLRSLSRQLAQQREEIQGLRAELPNAHAARKTVRQAAQMESLRPSVAPR